MSLTSLSCEPPQVLGPVAVIELLLAPLQGIVAAANAGKTFDWRGAEAVLFCVRCVRLLNTTDRVTVAGLRWQMRALRSFEHEFLHHSCFATAACSVLTIWFYLVTCAAGKLPPPSRPQAARRCSSCCPSFRSCRAARACCCPWPAPCLAPAPRGWPPALSKGCAAACWGHWWICCWQAWTIARCAQPAARSPHLNHTAHTDQYVSLHA